MRRNVRADLEDDLLVAVKRDRAHGAVPALRGDVRTNTAAEAEQAIACEPSAPDGEEVTEREPPRPIELEDPRRRRRPHAIGTRVRARDTYAARDDHDPTARKELDVRALEPDDAVAPQAPDRSRPCNGRRHSGWVELRPDADRRRNWRCRRCRSDACEHDRGCRRRAANHRVNTTGASLRSSTKRRLAAITGRVDRHGAEPGRGILPPDLPLFAPAAYAVGGRTCCGRPTP